MLIEIEPIVYISDACVLIDLHAVGLLNNWLAFRKSAITDLVLAEIQQEQIPNKRCAEAVQRYCDSGLLTLREITEDESAEIKAISRSRHSVSAQDISCFVAARADQTTVLSGDGSLRKLCAQYGIPLHGMLYVLDELVRAHQLENRLAISLIDALLRIGCRLPPDEVALRKKAWTKGSPLREP